MKCFDLSKNYLDDLEVLLRNTRSKLKKVLTVVSERQPDKKKLNSRV
jgi:hypothetical protein